MKEKLAENKKRRSLNEALLKPDLGLAGKLLMLVEKGPSFWRRHHRQKIVSSHRASIFRAFRC